MTRRILTMCVALMFSSGAFGASYFMRPITAVPAVENSPDKQIVVQGILERIQKICGAKFVASEVDSTAAVQIHVTYLKKVSGGARVLLGPFRGNSRIMLDLTVLDRSGAVKLRKQLRRSGSWIAGTVSFGGTDTHMLSVISQDICSLI